MYGDFVRRVRRARGLTQSELAEISGVRQSNLSAIESSRRVPSADTLNRLLVACGFELSATAGGRTIYCPLPRGGWFPDEDVPARSPGDPPDEDLAIGPSASPEDRARAIAAVLAAGEATRMP
ncbi:MAG TPA: helix-turn-helix transcriptional regulator [Egibacteraceae bacterium]|nr:helix-turn-helix transcriptional regulator [Egibacteraceae bacterium]